MSKERHKYALGLLAYTLLVNGEPKLLHLVWLMIISQTFTLICGLGETGNKGKPYSREKKHIGRISLWLIHPSTSMVWLFLSPFVFVDRTTFLRTPSHLISLSRPRRLDPRASGRLKTRDYDIAKPSKLWGLTSLDWTTRDRDRI